MVFSMSVEAGIQVKPIGWGWGATAHSPSLPRLCSSQLCGTAEEKGTKESAFSLHLFNSLGKSESAAEAWLESETTSPFVHGVSLALTLVGRTMEEGFLVTGFSDNLCCQVRIRNQWPHNWNQTIPNTPFVRGFGTRCTSHLCPADGAIASPRWSGYLL